VMASLQRCSTLFWAMNPSGKWRGGEPLNNSGNVDAPVGGVLSTVNVAGLLLSPLVNYTSICLSLGLGGVGP